MRYTAYCGKCRHQWEFTDEDVRRRQEAHAEANQTVLRSVGYRGFDAIRRRVFAQTRAQKCLKDAPSPLDCPLCHRMTKDIVAREGAEEPPGDRD